MPRSRSETRRAARPRAHGRPGNSGLAANAQLPAPAWDHPAARLAVAVAFACILVSVSFRLYEYDFWQHLTLGKAIWQLKAVPRVELWTWPDYGSARISPSWGFSFLLWPFWALGGDIGLATRRWLTTTGGGGLRWNPARAMGSRPLPPLVGLWVCGLLYRQRAQIRPETLAAVLLAAELWLLETRSRPGSGGDGGRGPARRRRG